MRFRAKMEETATLKQFGNLTHNLSKGIGYFVVRITSDKFVFIASDKDLGNTGVTTWCEVSKDSFSEFDMQGVTPEHNEIYLELGTEILSHILNPLRTSASVRSMKIKLTKKESPCLTFEVDMTTAHSSSVCIHDIPANIITRRNWDNYKEPEYPEFDISMDMPEIKLISQTLERLNKLGSTLIVRANKQGKLSLGIDDQISVKVTVTFTTGLKVYNYDTQDVQDQPRTKQPRTSNEGIFTPDSEGIDCASVNVVMKNVISLIPCDMKPTASVCSLLHERMLHLYFVFGNISLHHGIPSRY